MAWTQTDLDRIEAAIARGIVTVAFKDRTTTYASTTELLKARAEIKAELDAAGSSGSSSRDRVSYASHDKR